MDLFLRKFEALSIPGFAPMIAAALLWVSFPMASPAQRTAPSGHHVQAGVAVAGGVGLALGSVTASTVYTREVHVVANLRPIVDGKMEQYRFVLLMGASLRVFGFERLIGNAGYRGFDVDLGVRAGPGLSFSTRDSRIARNRRFVLILEPTARISRAFSSGSAMYAEVGTARPWLRIGVWIPW